MRRAVSIIIILLSVLTIGTAQVYVDTPHFQGGDINNFTKWVSEHLVYPEKFIAEKKEGRVTLLFTIDTNGYISKDIKILRGLSPETDAEAVRVVSSSPKFEPGYDCEGNPVSVTYHLPVIFMHPDKRLIMNAVKTQMELFPKSTLIDLYKNFFQDRFGPGHMMSDKASARKYLRKELLSEEVSEGPEYYSVGYNSRFYRVDLSVIKEGKVSFRKFFDAVVRSIKQTEKIDANLWPEEWKTIDDAIRCMQLNLPHEYDDRKIIDTAISKGEFVFHHSKTYSENYHPHYRLIEKSIFETEILPLLQK